MAPRLKDALDITIEMCAQPALKELSAGGIKKKFKSGQGKKKALRSGRSTAKQGGRSSLASIIGSLSGSPRAPLGRAWNSDDSSPRGGMRHRASAGVWALPPPVLAGEPRRRDRDSTLPSHSQRWGALSASLGTCAVAQHQRS